MIPGRIAASVRALCAIKDVSAADARAIRIAWHEMPSRRDARAEINRILGTFGVEYLGRHYRTHRDIYYCNAGDAYALTVCFSGNVLRVQCWGDYVDPVNRIHPRPPIYY